MNFLELKCSLPISSIQLAAPFNSTFWNKGGKKGVRRNDSHTKPFPSGLLFFCVNLCLHAFSSSSCGRRTKMLGRLVRGRRNTYINPKLGTGYCTTSKSNVRKEKKIRTFLPEFQNTFTITLN